MLWIHNKYAGLISGRVRNYNRVSSNLWNFSCPLCGDSRKHLNKARGYLYDKKGKLRYHCHNCSIDMPFDSFLKEVDEGLFIQMKKDILKENHDELKAKPALVFADKMKKPDYIKTSGLIDLKKVSQLPINHYCKKYVVDRGIPSNFHHELFFCPKFKEWTNTLIPEKFSKLDFDESRLIIPFLTKDKRLIGYQGRSFNKDDPVKYITIILDTDQPRVYGLDKVNTNHRYYATEGPIDAMFIKNTVASCGSDIVSEIEQAFLNKDNAVIVYDNEPRNKDTVKKLARAIRKGYKVVIWPDELNFKDINEMILNNYPAHQTIMNNIFKGLEAEVRLNTWKKI